MGKLIAPDSFLFSLFSRFSRGLGLAWIVPLPRRALCYKLTHTPIYTDMQYCIYVRHSVNSCTPLSRDPSSSFLSRSLPIPPLSIRGRVDGDIEWSRVDLLGTGD